MSVGHAVWIDAETSHALRFLFQVRENVHSRGVEIAEPRFVGLLLARDEVLRGGEKFLIDRLHPLGIERPRILDDLFADPSKGWIDRRIVDVGGFGLEHAAGPEFGADELQSATLPSRIIANAIRRLGITISKCEWQIDFLLGEKRTRREQP